MSDYLKRMSLSAKRDCTYQRLSHKAKIKLHLNRKRYTVTFRTNQGNILFSVGGVNRKDALLGVEDYFTDFWENCTRTKITYIKIIKVEKN